MAAKPIRINSQALLSGSNNPWLSATSTGNNKMIALVIQAPSSWLVSNCSGRIGLPSRAMVLPGCHWLRIQASWMATLAPYSMKGTTRRAKPMASGALLSKYRPAKKSDRQKVMPAKSQITPWPRRCHTGKSASDKKRRIAAVVWAWRVTKLIVVRFWRSSYCYFLLTKAVCGLKVLVDQGFAPHPLGDCARRCIHMGLALVQQNHAVAQSFKLF